MPTRFHEFRTALIILLMSLPALPVAAQTCEEGVTRDPDRLLACARSVESGSRILDTVAPHDGCRNVSSKFTHLTHKAVPGLEQGDPIACGVIAGVIERLNGRSAAWQGCVAYDPHADTKMQVLACLGPYLTERQGRGRPVDLAAILAPLECERMQRTYLAALGDAHHAREIEGGQLVRLPAGFVDPGCDVYDTIASEAQAEVARIAAEAQAAREAEQAAHRADREERRRAERNARTRQAEEKRRTAAEKTRAQGGTPETSGQRQQDLQSLLDILEAERGIRPEQSDSGTTGPAQTEESDLDAATRKAMESADKLRKSIEAAAAARAEYEALQQQQNNPDSGPEKADLRAGFLRALNAFYPERDCMDGFRSNLIAFPHIEICAHYIRFGGTCDQIKPGSFDCTLSFRINVTSPSHPNLTPQLQRNNQDHTIHGFLFTKTESGWVWDTTEQNVHAMVPSEFRHRDPF